MMHVCMCMVLLNVDDACVCVHARMVLMSIDNACVCALSDEHTDVCECS